MFLIVIEDVSFRVLNTEDFDWVFHARTRRAYTNIPISPRLISASVDPVSGTGVLGVRP